MKLKYLFLFLINVYFVKLTAQNAGTYDGTFSGDGKELYSKENTSSPSVFLYNNEYITFVSKNFDVPNNSPISQVEMVKHDLAGTFISAKIILSDSAKPQANMLDYYISRIKQRTDGKFVIATTDVGKPDTITYGTPYNSTLTTVDANGTLDATFGTGGRKIIITDTLWSSYDKTKELVFDLYTNNSIFLTHEDYNAGGYVRMKCYKINTIGSITNTPFLVGAGNVDYYIKDVYINADNSLYLAGATTYTNLGYESHYLFKLTSGSNYDLTFNTTGKLYISKGTAISYSGVAYSYYYPIKIASNGSDVFTYFTQQDTVAPDPLNRKDILYVQQYNSAGAFVAEKTLSDPASDIYLASDIKLDMNGKVVLLSTLYDTANYTSKTYLVRLNPGTMAYDNSFNSNGRKTLSFTGHTSNSGYSLLIQADNKIVVASDAFTANYDTRFALARINGGAIVTSISDLVTDSFISLYPNPANDVLKVAVTDQDQYPLTIELYNTNGQLVKNVRLESASDVISLTAIPNGFYVVKTSTSKGLKNNLKLSIQQ